MLLILHILIAVSSVFYTLFAFFQPSLGKLKLSYSMIAMTVVSGTVLAVSTQASILRACLMGLAYASIMFCMTAAVHYRLTSYSQ